MNYWLLLSQKQSDSGQVNIEVDETPKEVVLNAATLSAIDSAIQTALSTAVNEAVQLALGTAVDEAIHVSLTAAGVGMAIAASEKEDQEEKIDIDQLKVD